MRSPWRTPMTLQTCLSVVTMNVWGKRRWPDRQLAMRGFMETFVPDVLGIQEAAQPVQQAIAAALPAHQRVEDDDEAWREQGNIFWNTERLRLVAYGCEDIAGNKPMRPLFWVRLERVDTKQTLLVSNAHYTWPGNLEERETGQSPRVHQSRLTVDHLQRLAQPDEPVLFMGDLNEPVHPRKILMKAGYTDPFTELGLPAAPTRPARPIDNRPDEVDDWIFSNGILRARAALVPHYYQQDLPPSDHWPVLAMYEW